MTCIPPPGTKPGTLCVLRRGPWRCIGAWDGAGYTLARPNAGAPAGTLIDVHIPHAAGCRCGWVFAGVMLKLPRPGALRFVQAQGETFGEMRENVRNSPLYEMGDVRLVWVNEGDLYAVGGVDVSPRPQPGVALTRQEWAKLGYTQAGQAKELRP